MSKREDKERKDFDLGLGGLGKIFEGVEKIIDVAGELKKEGGQIKKEGSLDLGNLKEGMKGIFGFSVRTAEGGETKTDSFGNIKSGPKGPEVKEEREPLTDVFNEKEEVKVYAEMPGVNEEGISVDLKGDILEIKAVSKNRKYRKEILLPDKVKADTLEKSYKNGILEIRIRK